MHSTIILADKDNVAIALKDISENEPLDAIGVNAKSVIPQGHKISIRAINKGEAVFKYGQIIGRSQTNISAGEHVHTHNLEFSDEV